MKFDLQLYQLLILNLINLQTQKNVLKIKELNSKKDESTFLDLVNSIYKHEKNYIRPLDSDISKLFDLKTNKLLLQGKAKRWILLDNNEKPIGKIAAFINPKTFTNKNLNIGGIGFFECIDNQEAANLLFDTAKLWLTENGANAVDGPINFGERDRWWGLLVDGFTEPVFGMNYHPAYYKSLFENYGFQVYFKQYTFGRTIQKRLHQNIEEKAEHVLKNEGYTFKNIEKGNLDKYAFEFREVYNKAWVKHDGIGGMSEGQAKALMKSLKPILDEKLMWFGYYNNEPIAFFIMIPDLNQIFKKFNGKFGIINKLRFLYFLKTKQIKKILALVFGVVPQHQRKGVEAALIMAFVKTTMVKDFQYNDIEMNWIGDFNPKMLKVAEQIGGEIIKTHNTYRLIFDPNIPFERYKIIN